MRKALIAILTILFCIALGASVWIDLDEYSTDNIADAPTIPSGAIGVMSIPMIDVSIPLYYDADEQSVIDAKQSALYGGYDNGHCILDHYAQDGLILTRLRLNDALWLYYADGEWIYAKCISISKATVGKTHYIDLQGNEITIADTDYLVACCVGRYDNCGDYIVAVFREVE